MQYKIVSASSPEGLSSTINMLISEGWEPMGSHHVVVIHQQNRYSGMQHMDTTYKTEYSQTMIKQTTKNVIEVDVAYYHPDDENGNVDEDKQIYDLEGMLEEYHQKVQNLLLNDFLNQTT